MCPIKTIYFDALPNSTRVRASSRACHLLIPALPREQTNPAGAVPSTGRILLVPTCKTRRDWASTRSGSTKIKHRPLLSEMSAKNLESLARMLKHQGYCKSPFPQVLEEMPALD